MRWNMSGLTAHEGTVSAPQWGLRAVILEAGEVGFDWLSDQRG